MPAASDGIVIRMFDNDATERLTLDAEELAALEWVLAVTRRGDVLRTVEVTVELDADTLAVLTRAIDSRDLPSCTGRLADKVETASRKIE